MMSAKVEQLVMADRSSIGELYLRHADAAARLAYLLTGDRELAEDLVQDAFVRLAGRLVHLREPEAFESYLRTTIVNLSRSYFRRRRVERNFLAKASGRTRAESPAGSVEARDELWRALGRLSQRQRAAIVLRIYEDLSEPRVAEILGCRPGTVKSLVSRGIQLLRQDIRGETDE